MVLAVQIDKNLFWKLVSDGAGRTDGVTPSVRRSMALLQCRCQFLRNVAVAAAPVASAH